MKSSLRLSLVALASAAAFTVRADTPPSQTQDPNAPYGTAHVANEPGSAVNPARYPTGDELENNTAGQPPRGERGRMREHRLKMLTEKLSLTSDQQAKVKALFDQAEQQGRALRDDDSLTREARRDKAVALMKSTHDQVRAVLTPDQQKTFDAMPPERPMRRGPRGGGDGDKGPPPPPPQA